jgi:hypothetical protein
VIADPRYRYSDAPKTLEELRSGNEAITFLNHWEARASGQDRGSTDAGMDEHEFRTLL